MAVLRWVDPNSVVVEMEMAVLDSEATDGRDVLGSKNEFVHTVVSDWSEMVPLHR